MDEVLALLISGDRVSGQRISAALGISRAAVWKRVQRLRALGLDIRGEGRGGYRLCGTPEALQPAVLAAYGVGGRQVCCLPSVDSTNARAKALAQGGAPHGALVVADEQTCGRGRRGHGWHSPPGLGIWCSVILRPQVQTEAAPGLTLVTALAVADGLRSSCGLDTAIKWPNDLRVGERKLCGILLELSADMEGVQWVVAGIGVNVGHRRADFPPDLGESATSLAMELGAPPPRAGVLAAILAALDIRYAQWATDGLAALMPDYTARSATLGQRVRVCAGQGAWDGLALGVDGTGALLVRDDGGTERRVLAAEVSIRRSAHG
ncbi:MAG: biotin--[acetyl-CoA-carboxylase] ligase [Oscillospiraceae bacterium]|nr:biotin--[acetyl-CoA-carboxylase] ligase [Oscillospiraceae bacterium]